MGTAASWGDDDVVALFATDGVSDPGEAAALATVRTQAAGRVLDLGIGGGRTTGLLAGGAASYLGIDLAPEMVALARRRFPDLDLRAGDAGDLSALPDAAFDLVVWSFNGLDALDHRARTSALAGLARVTAPGGRVLFSSLNLDGVSYDERPWRVPRPTGRRARRILAVTARHPSVLVRGVRNYRTTRAQSVDGAGWAMRPLRAHEFRFVVHFATLAEIVAEVRAAGLEVEGAWSEAGRPVDPAAARTNADYLHLVCRTTTADAARLD